MREKLETLTLTSLRELAKQNGVKSVTTMKKSDLINALIKVDEEMRNSAAQGAQPAAAQPQAPAQSQSAAAQPVKRGPGRPRKHSQEERPAIERTDRTERSERTERTERNDRPERRQERNERYDTRQERTDRQPVQQQGGYGYRGRDVRNDQARTDDIVIAGSSDPIPEGNIAGGILEVMQDGYGFIRCENYLPGDDDVYVAPALIRRFNLKTGDIIKGRSREKRETDKFAALNYLESVNTYPPEVAIHRWSFERMTPIFPNQRIHLETPGAPVSMRIMDLISPIGKGQRGMIVSPPKAGKTTLLKQVAQAVKRAYPNIHLIVLLIDERPEEVTDIKESIEGNNSEVIYSTFDELPDHHKRVAEMVMERAKRLVELNQDVFILLDSITRLTRAYNIVVPPSGRTLSGGLDPAALHMPKKFFGAARCMREGGSLTVLATALIETGSKMDDVIYEEFKGTGNMEMVLDRKLQEKRVFPAINIPKSSTRREDLLLSPEELSAVNTLRKGFNGMKPDDAVEQCINLFSKTRTNIEFVRMVEKQIMRYQ